MSTIAPATAVSSEDRTLADEFRDALEARGCDPARRPGESVEGHLDRIDTALMGWFRDTGAREAFDALYRHSHARVVSWLRWAVAEQRARLDPVELVQDTYVNVYRYARGFRSDHGGSFRVWVRTIASNVVRRARSAAARLRYVSADEQAFLVVESEHRSPHARAMECEETDGLRGAYLILLQHYLNAFAQLSPRDRRALELVELDGLSYAQVCEVLGVGHSNMKMIMLRARRRLLAHMTLSLQAAAALAA